jgi:hypothetical protein
MDRARHYPPLVVAATILAALVLISASRNKYSRDAVIDETTTTTLAHSTFDADDYIESNFGSLTCRSVMPRSIVWMEPLDDEDDE